MFPARYFPVRFFPRRYWAKSGASTPSGGLLYVVVASPTNVYTVTAEPTNTYSIIAIPTNTYTVTATLHMATTRDIRCFRGEKVTVAYTVTGLASLVGIPFYWNLVDDAGNILSTLSTLSGDITISTGTGTLVIPASVTDRTPGIYYHALGRTDSPTMEIEGKFWIKAPTVPTA